MKYLLAILIFISCTFPVVPHDPTVCDSIVIKDSIIQRDSIIFRDSVLTIIDTLWTYRDSTIINYKDSILWIRKDTTVVNCVDSVTYINCPDTITEAIPIFEIGFEVPNWEQLIRNQFGLSWQYSCPNLSDNYYEIAEDPLNENNHVLHLRINKGCDYSGRVQGTLTMPQKEVYHFKQQCYLGNDFADVSGSSYLWLSFVEIWEKDNTNRWSVYFYRNEFGKLYWKCSGEQRLPVVKTLFDHSSNAIVPVGRWFDFELEFERSNPGQIFVKVDNKVIFDVQGITDTGLPITWFQIWKLYANVETVNDFISKGKTLDYYFDNLKWYEN